MIDENLLFIILLTLVIVFIANKSPRFVITFILIVIIYFFYKRHFVNPKEFMTFMKKQINEAFQPCNNSNMGYCDNESSSSNTTFLPDIMRSSDLSMTSNINNSSVVKLKKEDFLIDKRLKLGKEEITIEEIIRTVPLLINYKTYLETLIQFVMNIKTDDSIQKEFLGKKIRHTMSKVFYNAYNTVSNKKYPIYSYNKLLYSQREVNNTLNIFTFLGLNDYENNKLLELQKEFKTMNDTLNEYIVEKVNDITPNNYDITTSFLPRKDEPEPAGINYLNDTDYTNYTDL